MQIAHNLLAGGRIKIACRLVGKNQLRTVKQRTSYDDALLLAARQFVGHLVGLGEHAHLLQHLFNALVDFVVVLPSRGLKHKCEIVVDRAVGKELKVLEHYAYLTAQVRNLLTFYGSQIIFKHLSFAVLNRDFGIHGLKKRALAASHLTNYICKLPLVDGQIYILQNHMFLTEQFHIGVFD